jgi:pimeloyl-ACP methyl ester carboxylesterase
MKPTTLLLLPGLDGTDIFFQPLLAALPAAVQARVVRYPAAMPQDYAALLALVRREIADLPHCHVLGWSFSGPLALMLAAAEPHRVRSVILAASFVRAPNALAARLRFALVAPLIWGWRAVRRLPLLLRPGGDAWRRAKMQSWRQVGARTLAARLRAIMAVDVRAELCALPQPVLYLASGADGIVPQRNRDEIVRLRPSVQLATIPGHHQSLYSRPQEAARVIMEFLARADAVPMACAAPAG